MRPAEGRPGQRCYVSIRGEINKRCEALFLFEEGSDAHLAISFTVMEGVEGEHEPVVLNNPEGRSISLFLITAAIGSLSLAKPATWDADFVPLYPPGAAGPSLSIIMAAMSGEYEPVESEAEPATPSEPSARVLDRGPQSSRLAASFAPPSRSIAAPGRLVSSGMGQSAATRIASIYTTELDEEDDEEGFDHHAPETADRRSRTTASPNSRLQVLEKVLGEPGSSGQVDATALVQLEILRTLREMREDDQKRRADLDDGDDLDAPRAQTSLGKAVKGMQRHRETVRDRPKAVCTAYREECLLDLHVRGGEPWSYTDMNRRVTWNHFSSLQRAHLLFSHIVQLLDDGEPLRAQALAVQSCKACHQACLSGGQWRLAWPFTGLPDPLSRRRFAGSASELEVMADWIKAEDEIEKKAKGAMDGTTTKSEGAEDKPAWDDRSQTAASKKAAKAAAAKKKATEG